MRTGKEDTHPRNAYVNGKVIPISEASISILDRGFLFGDGVYEVTAILNGQLVDNPAHLARLERSLSEIELRCPVPLSELPARMQSFVASEGVREGMLYLQITRGADTSRAFPFPDPEKVPPTLVMFAMEKKLIDASVAETGTRAITVPDIRWSRRDIKSVSLLGQVLCKQAAVAAGVDEALLVEDGFITEGSSSGVCILTRNDVLVSRPARQDLLDSITRKAAHLLAGEMSIPIEERPFTTEEALNAKEVFCTSASTLIHGVVEIDGHKIGNGKPGPVTRRLRELYLEIAGREPVIVHNPVFP